MNLGSGGTLDLLTIIGAGLSMGVAGSLHCVGMCGPLITAVFHAKPSHLGFKFVYNFGRILVYLLLGAIAGILGYALDLIAFQKFLSLFLGIILILFGLFGFRNLTFPAIDKQLNWLTNKLKQAFSNWLGRKGVFPTFMLGLLNGFLPCGLTYMALAYAITLPNSISSGLFMFSFGLGTFPAMIGIPVVMGMLGTKYASVVRKFNAVLLIGLGALLVWRGYMQFQEGMHGSM